MDEVRVLSEFIEVEMHVVVVVVHGGMLARVQEGETIDAEPVPALTE